MAEGFDAKTDFFWTADPAPLECGIGDATVREISGEKTSGNIRAGVHLMMHGGGNLRKIDVVARRHDLLDRSLGFRHDDGIDLPAQPLEGRDTDALDPALQNMSEAFSTR
jgi:hypothetical protein